MNFKEWLNSKEPKTSLNEVRFKPRPQKSWQKHFANELVFKNPTQQEAQKLFASKDVNGTEIIAGRGIIDDEGNVYIWSKYSWEHRDAGPILGISDHERGWPVGFYLDDANTKPKVSGFSSELEYMDAIKALEENPNIAKMLGNPPPEGSDEATQIKRDVQAWIKRQKAEKEAGQGLAPDTGQRMRELGKKQYQSQLDR